MQQMNLSHQAEFQRYSKKTRQEQFLEEMDAVMPWAELLSLVEPHYSKSETGRKPVGLSIMLRVYFCNIDSRFRTRRARTRSTNLRCCGALLALIFYPTDEDLSAWTPVGQGAGAGHDQPARQELPGQGRRNREALEPE